MAVVRTPRAKISHGQASASRTKAEVSTASPGPVWSACPFILRGAKHGAMKCR